MAQQELSPADQQSVATLLDSDLRKRYLRYRPKTMLPFDVEAHGKGGESLIVTDYARFVEDRKHYSNISRELETDFFDVAWREPPSADAVTFVPGGLLVRAHFMGYRWRIAAG